MLRSWRQALGRMRVPAGRPLIPPDGRRIAVTILAACVAVTTVLGARYSGQTSAGHLDLAVDDRIQAMLGGHHAALNSLAKLGDPFTVAQMGSVLFVICLVLRRWRGAVLVAVASPAADAITEFVLKPLFNRTLQGQLSLPSGHTTGAFALAVTVAVLLVNPERPRIPAALRGLLAVCTLAVAVAVAISLVGLAAHYFTDTVAGAAVGTAVVLATALIVDRFGRSPRLPPDHLEYPMAASGDSGRSPGIDAGRSAASRSQAGFRAGPSDPRPAGAR